jgi:hypothetical protein
MMKLSKVLILVLALLIPQLSMAQRSSAADRAWKPFFATFRAVVKKRNQDALNKMMAREFYYLSSGGDENGNADSRDEAFDYWESSRVDMWGTLDKILAQGTVKNTAMLDLEIHGPSRLAPPLANNARAIKERSFDWFAVFEYKRGRWYWVGFTECCD